MICHIKKMEVIKVVDIWALGAGSSREETQERDDGETTTPLTLLKRLNAYRKQCESNGEYVEAQKARRKYEERSSSA